MAICESCGTVFPSGIAAHDDATVMVFGTRSGPCPRCGGDGSVPNGVYGMVRGTLQGILASGVDAVGAEHLAQRLQDLRDAPESLTVEKVREVIREAAPELTGFSKWLPDRPDLLLAFISILIGALLGWGVIPNPRHNDDPGELIDRLTTLVDELEAESDHDEANSAEHDQRNVPTSKPIDQADG